MKHLTESTLSVIDRASAKLGPLSSLLDKFVERVVPTTTASACFGIFCEAACDTGQRCNANHRTYGHYYYATSPSHCTQGKWSCITRFCGC